MRMGVGLVAMVAVLALVAFMTMVSSNGGGNSVSASGPRARTNPIDWKMVQISSMT